MTENLAKLELPETPHFAQLEHARLRFTFWREAKEVLGWRLKPHPQDVAAMIVCP